MKGIHPFCTISEPWCRHKVHASLYLQAFACPLPPSVACSKVHLRQTLQILRSSTLVKGHGGSHSCLPRSNTPNPSSEKKLKKFPNAVLLNAVGCRNMQITANERKRAQMQVHTRVQSNAKEHFHVKLQTWATLTGHAKGYAMGGWCHLFAFKKEASCLPAPERHPLTGIDHVGVTSCPSEPEN